jgi:ABC-type sugar transport system ATPase subunit
LYGLIGAGRTELMRTLFGLEEKAAGAIELHGKAVELRSPRAAIAADIGMVPEDRKRQGLVLGRSIKENISLSKLRQLSVIGFVKKREETTVVDAFIKRLSIRAVDREAKVFQLTGGNQQKVVISRVLANEPQIIVFDEPTRGIDVGARQEVYRIMVKLLELGKSIIMVSSDIREVIGMSHRILVMSEGSAAAELPGQITTQEQVLLHSFPGRSRTQHTGN